MLRGGLGTRLNLTPIIRVSSEKERSLVIFSKHCSQALYLGGRGPGNEGEEKGPGKTHHNTLKYVNIRHTSL